jgi:hypothetical protein
VLNFSVQSLGAIQGWQGRLARVPKWAWVLFIAGVILPLVVMGVLFVMLGLIVRAVLRIGMGLIGLLTGGSRGVNRELQSPVDDGRRNVRVMVHSARVIDE